MQIKLIKTNQITFENAISWGSILPEAKHEKNLSWWQIAKKYSPDNPKLIEDRIIDYLYKLKKEVV